MSSVGNAGSLIVTLLTVVFAIYGIVMLVRKVQARKDKNPKGDWHYYVEPYAATEGGETKSGTSTKKDIVIFGSLIAVVVLFYVGYSYFLNKRGQTNYYDF